MTGLLAFAAALALAHADAPAAAPARDPQPMDGTWRAVSIDNEGPSGRAVAFIEPSSIVREGDAIRFRLDVRLESAESGADSIVTMVQADCAARRYEMRDIASYRARRLLDSGGSLPVAEARPDSNMAGVLDRACGGTYLSGPVDREQYVRDYFGPAPAK